ncbi:uncharacterized protein LOC127127773 isoform X2 [Lathyrus oleraceus]|uniref:uncharacterized protein LOC127127773 isoform X2 n=1 Tax=Pisum sativum TaxID=3888 RepID=UPI0021D011B3|nr:uncharacterized protein LOC127127773 isoform X2 [Pisum sativum]
MAEISDSPPESRPVEENTQTQITDSISELDSKTMRKTKPGVKRLIMTLTVLVSFILLSPLLLKSIEIYRAPLPFDEIDSFSSKIESNRLLFPCGFRAIFVGFNFRVSNYEVGEVIRSKMSELSLGGSRCGCSNDYSVSAVLDLADAEVNAVDFGGKLRENDEEADEMVKRLVNVYGEEKVYSVVVVNGEEEVKAVVGKYRHAWILGKVSEEDAVVRVAEIFSKVFVNGGSKDGLIHNEFMPVGADGRIVLSFSLLNTDPQDWVYDWDFSEIDEALLQPVIQALQPIADVTVESQVLYHTPKASFSYWDDEHGSHIFTAQDLPFFVNSNEWHLDTSVAAGGRSKVLQLVVYIPSAKECPLQLELPNGDLSKTNGFISPMWGGVVVWNPQSCIKDVESKDLVRHKISPQDLQKLFEVLMGQIRQLLGLKSDDLYVGESGTSTLLGSERGFTEWELDFLSRKHFCFNLLSCATTLKSLSKLVQSLPRMIIMDEIGKQVTFSLEAAKSAQINASVGMYDASAVSSRQSRTLAEDAFFHPSIMSISYYSFEHCFAIYSIMFTFWTFITREQRFCIYLLWKHKSRLF